MNEVVKIPVGKLQDSTDNFFEVARVEELAETILGQGGVKSNLIVKPLNNGNYEIISGHRRAAAVRYLLEQGKTISQELPCIVQNYKDEEEKQLDLILMNVSSRVISDSELWKSYEVVDTILKHKKEAGEKFGRVRDKLGEILGISSGKTAQLQSVKKHAPKEIITAVESGEMSIHSASELVKSARAQKPNTGKCVKVDTNSEKPTENLSLPVNGICVKVDTNFEPLIEESRQLSLTAPSPQTKPVPPPVLVKVSVSERHIPALKKEVTEAVKRVLGKKFKEELVSFSA